MRRLAQLVRVFDCFSVCWKDCVFLILQRAAVLDLQCIVCVFLFCILHKVLLSVVSSLSQLVRQCMAPAALSSAHLESRVARFSPTATGLTIGSDRLAPTFHALQYRVLRRHVCDTSGLLCSKRGQSSANL